MNFADHEELERRMSRRERQRRKELTFDILTGIVLVATAALIGIVLVMFANPFTSLNPFPPPTLPVLVKLETKTATPFSLPPTWTPTQKPTQTTNPTFTATSTPEPTETPTTTPVPTLSSTFVPGNFPFMLKGEPVYTANNVFHPDADCNWQGVAGTLVDLQGKNIVGTLVRLGGVYDGRTLEMTTLTGGAQAWYGASGFEFVLGQKPLNTTATLYVQLIDQALQPISDRVVINTYDTCDKNLTLVNFKQVR